MNPDLVEVKKENPHVKCVFCSKFAINEIEWGPMYQLEEITLHYFCMLFSSGLKQNGNDDEGILGFLLADLRKEIKRGEKLKCKICHVNRATVGCCVKQCKWSFHFTCGLTKGTLHEFTENFASYCHMHKSRLNIPQELSWECAVCYSMVENNEDPRNGNPVWPPCCKKRVFHRYCIQQYAQNSGYCFSCPSCRSVNEFTEAMKLAGVYVPEQDASWERGPGAYAELYAQYSRCDAEECQCPRGVDYDSKNHRAWKIIRCSGCGSSAIHYSCGQLKSHEWKCPGCIVILDTGFSLRSDKALPDLSESSDDDDESSSSEDEGDPVPKKPFETIHDDCRMYIASRSSLVGVERESRKVEHPIDFINEATIEVDDADDEDDDDDIDSVNKSNGPREKLIRNNIIVHSTFKRKKYRMEVVADVESTSSSSSSSSGIDSGGSNSSSSGISAKDARSKPSAVSSNVSHSRNSIASNAQVQPAVENPHSTDWGKKLSKMHKIQNLELDEHDGRHAAAVAPFPPLVGSVPSSTRKPMSRGENIVSFPQAGNYHNLTLSTALQEIIYSDHKRRNRHYGSSKNKNNSLSSISTNDDSVVTVTDDDDDHVDMIIISDDDDDPGTLTGSASGFRKNKTVGSDLSVNQCKSMVITLSDTDDEDGNRGDSPSSTADDNVNGKSSTTTGKTKVPSRDFGCYRSDHNRKRSISFSPSDDNFSIKFQRRQT